MQRSDTELIGSLSATRTLLIAGAQKSSSTSLAELIGRHPHVSMAGREILGFEDPYYPKGLTEVLAHVENSTDRGLVPALKRPELLYREESVRRARHHLRDAVVVVVLREPVGRTISAYHHYMKHGLLPAVHANVGIDALLDEWSLGERVDARSEVIRYSLYSRPLIRLQKQFGSDLVVLFQEELHSRTSDCISEICRLLDIEPFDLGPLPRANPGDYSLRRIRPSRLGGRIGYAVDKNGAFSVTTRPARRIAGRALFALDRLCTPTADAPPQLDAPVRRRLVGVLAADAQLLPDILGRHMPDEWASSLRL